jgi:hypothetical protein
MVSNKKKKKTKYFKMAELNLHIEIVEMIRATKIKYKIQWLSLKSHFEQSQDKYIC